MKKSFLFLMAFSSITLFFSCSSDDDDHGSQYDAHRGIVKENQEVDMGLTVEIDGKNYNVIFAMSNLTATGLAAKASDFGDYFAWAATEPWYTSYSLDSLGQPIADAWKESKSGGYDWTNVPYRDFSKDYSFSKYTQRGDVLEMTDDAAHVILGGDWRLPTVEIWDELSDTTAFTWSLITLDGRNVCQVTSLSDNSKSLFLPAAGFFRDTIANQVDSIGYYWSGTAFNVPGGWSMYFNDSSFFYFFGTRNDGLSIRPVRLVEVK